MRFYFARLHLVQIRVELRLVAVFRSGTKVHSVEGNVFLRSVLRLARVLLLGFSSYAFFGSLPLVLVFLRLQAICSNAVISLGSATCLISFLLWSVAPLALAPLVLLGLLWVPWSLRRMDSLSIASFRIFLLDFFEIVHNFPGGFACLGFFFGIRRVRCLFLYEPLVFCIVSSAQCG